MRRDEPRQHNRARVIRGWIILAGFVAYLILHDGARNAILGSVVLAAAAAAGVAVTVTAIGVASMRR